MLLRAVLTFDARCKSRLLLTLDNGEQAALIVERGRILRDGERVKIGDGREVEIVGLKVDALVAPFEPERGAYGHQHAHGRQDAQDSETPVIRPKIHSFSSQ
jgi:urease accessory protein UreE